MTTVPASDVTQPRRADRFGRWARMFEDEPVSRLLVDLQRVAFGLLEVRSGDRVLDVGCGTAAALRTETRAGVTRFGVDRSPAMLHRARQLASDAGQRVPALLVGDALALPFVAGAFDAVLCTATLRHLPDAPRALREMRRVLARDGRLVLGDFATSTPSPPRHRRRRRAVSDLAESAGDAGLCVVRIVEQPSLLGRYVVVLAQS